MTHFEDKPVSAADLIGAFCGAFLSVHPRRCSVEFLYTSLDQNKKVSEFPPLRAMPLINVDCDFDMKRDAAVLRSIATLETINGKSAKEALGQGDEMKP